jgi:hypothetical protein
MEVSGSGDGNTNTAPCSLLHSILVLLLSPYEEGLKLTDPKTCE